MKSIETTEGGAGPVLATGATDAEPAQGRAGGESGGRVEEVGHIPSPGPRFAPVFDARNRRVKHLETRNGVFWAQLWVDRGDGKKTARRFRLKTPEGRDVANLPEARAALELLRQDRREDRLPTMGAKPTLAEYAKTYLASGVFQRKKEGTQELERMSLEKWARQCGGVRVDKLTSAHVSGFIDRRLKGQIAPGRRVLRPVGERTVQLDLVTLRNLLNAARDDGHLRELPRFPRLKPPPPLKKPTVEPVDVERLITQAPAACDRNGEQLRDYLRFLCFCGAREAEALRIRWEDVDFMAGTLTIGADGDTKNRRSRVVEFNPSLAAHLVEMKARRAPDSVYLFPSPRRGSKDRPAKSFRESLRLTRAAAGLPDFGFHDCRRFFATMAIQSGVDIQTVARWLGHQDGGVLVAKTYADVLSDHRRRMAAGVTFGAAPAAPLQEGAA